MKIRKLIKKLMEQKERIPIIALGTNGVERSISREFVNDGPDWETFSFKLGTEREGMDTDYCKFAMDYSMNDPDMRPSLFAGQKPFEDYRVNIIWQDATCCGWYPEEIASIRIEERKLPWKTKKKTKVMVLVMKDELPEYGEENELVETEPEKEPEHAGEIGFEKGDRIAINIHGKFYTGTDTMYEIDPDEDGKRRFMTSEYLTRLIEYGATLYHVSELKEDD